MIHQDGQTTANQERHKKEIEEVAVTHPDWKAVRRGEVVRLNQWNGWDVRHSCDGGLDPGRSDCRENCERSHNQDGRSDPEPKTAIGRIMNGFMGRIE